MNSSIKYKTKSVQAVYCIVFTFALFVSCKKEKDLTNHTASVKIIDCINEPKQVKLIPSKNGVILTFINSGTVVTPIMKQELFLMTSKGELIKRVNLSDTIYQFMNAVPGINGGFFICASSNGSPSISLFSIGDDGSIIWSKNMNVTFGTNLNAPDVTISRDNNYLILFQSYGSGYYINKTDPAGNEISNKKIPPPGYVHQGPGLNFGERYEQLFQPNDSTIVVQGIAIDKYSQRIENCFIRALTSNITQRWFSTNYDSTHFESGTGLIYHQDKIVLFGNKSDNAILEGFGNVFARIYNLNGTLEQEIVYPQINYTPTAMKRIIPSPDGGYLLVGSHNQLSLNDVVSPNNIAMMKLRSDFTLEWSKSIKTFEPSKGFDVAYLNNGNIGIVGLLKSNLEKNKLMYLHMDALGNLINN